MPHSSLDEYLGKQPGSRPQKTEGDSLDEYLGKTSQVQEESDPEGRILFNTTCTLKDFGMEGAVGPKHYVAFSGGKDSSAMLVRMLELGMPVDHVLFADTGMEFPEIYAHLHRMDSWLRTNYDLHVTWLKPKSTWDTWFYGAVTRGKMKGQRRGYPLFLFPCWWTRESKFKVMDPIIGCGNFRYLGFAADEPKRLKPKPGYRYPLAEWGWTEGDALRYLTEQGLAAPIHHKFNRTGCYLCPKQHVRSLTTLCKEYPELWTIAKKYEADSPQGFRPDLKLSDIEQGRSHFAGPLEVGRFG